MSHSVLRKIAASILIIMVICSVLAVLFFAMAYFSMLGICECFDIALYSKIIGIDAGLTIGLLGSIFSAFLMPAMRLLRLSLFEKLKKYWILHFAVSILVTAIAYFFFVTT